MEIAQAEDTAREVVRHAFAGRSDEEVFNGLAWLYDGFVVPTRIEPVLRCTDPRGE